MPLPKGLPPSGPRSFPCPALSFCSSPHRGHLVPSLPPSPRRSLPWAVSGNRGAPVSHVGVGLQPRMQMGAQEPWHPQGITQASRCREAPVAARQESGRGSLPCGDSAAQRRRWPPESTGS